MIWLLLRGHTDTGSCVALLYYNVQTCLTVSHVYQSCRRRIQSYEALRLPSGHCYNGAQAVTGMNAARVTRAPLSKPRRHQPRRSYRHRIEYARIRLHGEGGWACSGGC